MLECSFQPIRTAFQPVAVVAYKKLLILSRILVVGAMDLFVATEEDYCLKGTHFVILSS